MGWTGGAGSARDRVAGSASAVGRPWAAAAPGRRRGAVRGAAGGSRAGAHRRGWGRGEGAWASRPRGCAEEGQEPGPSRGGGGAGPGAGSADPGPGVGERPGASRALWARGGDEASSLRSGWSRGSRPPPPPPCRAVLCGSRPPPRSAASRGRSAAGLVTPPSGFSCRAPRVCGCWRGLGARPWRGRESGVFWGLCLGAVGVGRIFFEKREET